MVAGAAGNDVQAAHLGEQFVAIHAKNIGKHAVRTDACFERGRHCIGLLEDFLLHVVAVFATLHCVGGQLAFMHGTLDAFPAEAVDLHTVARDLGNVVLVEINDLVGDLDKRLRVRAQEMLANTHANQQRCAVTRTDHTAGLLAADDGNGVSTFESTHGGQHRFAQAQARLHMLVDQRRHHLGIGFRSEHVAARLQVAAQAGVVLDDAVVHQRDAAGHVRMRIGLVGHAMRRPARMRDAGATGERIGQVLRFHLAHLALGAHATDFALVQHGQAGRVVAAVFQRLQSGNQQRRHITLGSSGNDSTHSLLLLGNRCDPSDHEARLCRHPISTNFHGHRRACRWRIMGRGSTPDQCTLRRR